MNFKLLLSAAVVLAISAFGLIVTLKDQPPATQPSVTATAQADPPAKTQAAFDKDAKAQGFMPYGKSELEYEIKVPKDWESDEDKGAQSKLREGQ